MRAVRFDSYGPVDVLEVREVPTPAPGPGELLIEVRAAAINPGEAKIRDGSLDFLFPAKFPEGEGSDLSGVVAQVGAGVTAFGPGDAVIGFTDNRASHAEYAVVSQANATLKPAGVSFEVAGTLYVAGTTAVAMTDAIKLSPGETVLVGGATGGVGVFATQLARLAGASVLAVAGPRAHGWLRRKGAIPIAYGEGLDQRVAQAADGKLDAVLDIVGGYAEVGLRLGVAPERIDTIMGHAMEFVPEGIHQAGNAEGGGAAGLQRLAGLIEAGQLEVPIAASYPLERVADAYTALAQERPLGKIVLVP